MGLNSSKRKHKQANNEIQNTKKLKNSGKSTITQRNPLNIGNNRSSLVLTEEEIAKIQRIWSMVAKNISQTSRELFYAIFRAHPEYQELFSDFRNLPISELESCTQFRAHAMLVTFTLSSCVHTLDDQGSFEAFCRKIGRDHHQKRIKIEMFKQLMSVLVDFLQETLGHHYMDHEAVEAWEKFGEILIKHIHTGMKEIRGSGRFRHS